MEKNTLTYSALFNSLGGFVRPLFAQSQFESVPSAWQGEWNSNQFHPLIILGVDIGSGFVLSVENFG